MRCFDRSVAAYVVFATCVRSPRALAFGQVLRAARALPADEQRALVDALVGGPT